MTIPSLTFFNNKGGVGKTTLVYHIAWMFAELGVKTLVIDCDPQANLTAAFLDDGRLISLWDQNPHNKPRTIYEAVRPLSKIGDFEAPETISINQALHLLPGDLGLSAFEDLLSEQWTKANGDDTNERAMLILGVFWRVAQNRAMDIGAKLIIFDVGPNLGAINRSVLIGTDHVIVPLAADLFSLQGLRNLGPALVKWRKGWEDRRTRIGDAVGELPSGRAQPIGYLALQHQERLSRPVQAYVAWLDKIPFEYRKQLLDSSASNIVPAIQDDEFCLALLRHYKSLIPLAQDARKPVFMLRPADGAIGSHVTAVNRAYKDFHKLASNILQRIGISPELSLSIQNDK
jgi:chromosome partitioning protein